MTDKTLVTAEPLGIFNSFRFLAFQFFFMLAYFLLPSTQLTNELEGRMQEVLNEAEYVQDVSVMMEEE